MVRSDRSGEGKNVDRGGEPDPRRWGLIVAGCAAASISLTVFALYFLTGAVNVDGGPVGRPPPAAEQMAEPHDGGDVEPMIRNLADRLAGNPDDADGWLLLARSYGAMARYAEAADAFVRFFALRGDMGEYRGEYAEALVGAAGGIVTPTAADLFEAVLVGDPGDPRARYYVALARAQAGRSEQAVQMLLALESDLPPDTTWLSTVRAQIADIAAGANIDVAALAGGEPPRRTVPAPAPSGPVALPSGEQGEMIRQMVAGLAARLESEPGDIEGWKRLGRSYVVLNQPDHAMEALANAVRLAPRDMELLRNYADVSLSANGEIAPLAEDTIAVMRDLLAKNPDDRQALWYVGLADAQAGATESARRHWTRLLDGLDPESPTHAAVKRRYEGLGGNGG